MKVAFLGNHTVGVRTLAAIAESEDVVAVVAHPPDPEDGVRYESVHDVAAGHTWDVRRLAGRDPKLVPFLRERAPDLLFVADYRYLLPGAVFAAAPFGAVNLHPSLLPRYRGRAPLNWAILEGERTLGLTAHFVDEGADSGDVIAQRSFDLTEEEDVGDALEKLYPLYEELTREVLACFRAGRVPRTPQNVAGTRVYPARSAEDGRIDWTRPTEQVRDLVRAVARPYPGAFSALDGRRLLVWRARTTRATGRPGEVVGVEDGSPVVACGRGGIVLLEPEWEGGGAPVPDELAGRRLG